MSGKIALLVLCVAGSMTRAEILGPGTYHGYFCENRWGQKVFHHGPYHYFVGDAAKALEPHVGKPLEIEVLEMSQPMNPGAGLIQKVGKITEKEAVQGLTLTATLKSDQVAQGDGVTVRVTLRNGSAEEVEVRPRELAFMLVTDSPFSSDKIGYEHPEDRAFWYYSYGYLSFGGDGGAKVMRIACHQVDVLGKDKAIKSMKPKEVFEAEFTVGEKLLPDDYEVFALLTPSYKSPLVGPMSKRLAFDVVAKEAGDDVKVLDAEAESVQKQEVRHSMLGVRDTVVFYTFPEQQAVLRVRIGNADTTFPLEARLHAFAAATTAEGLKKWVNNQHSDALFADAPQPTATYKIPSTQLKIESHQRTGRSKLHNGEFDDYKVKFRIGDFATKAGPKLKGFTGETLVHVQAG